MSAAVSSPSPRSPCHNHNQTPAPGPNALVPSPADRTAQALRCRPHVHRKSVTDHRHVTVQHQIRLPVRNPLAHPALNQTMLIRSPFSSHHVLLSSPAVHAIRSHRGLAPIPVDHLAVPNLESVKIIAVTAIRHPRALPPSDQTSNSTKLQAFHRISSIALHLPCGRSSNRSIRN